MIHQLDSVLTLSQSTMRNRNGLLGRIVEAEMKATYQHELKPDCELCGSEMQIANRTELLSKFLILELGLCESKNLQNPPVQIPQDLTIFDRQFALTGSLLVNPGHFFTIAKIDSNFCVIDDLKSKPVPYPTFSAAVKQNLSCSTTHVTSNSHPGIHILVYMDSTAASSQPVHVAVSTKSKRSSIPVLRRRNNACHRLDSNNKPTFRTSSSTTLSKIPVPVVVAKHGKRKRLSNHIEGPQKSKRETKKETSPPSDLPVPCKSKKMTINGQQVRWYSTRKNYFSCHDSFTSVGLYSSIRKSGFKTVDQCLIDAGFGIQDSFIFKGRYRIYIEEKALVHVLKMANGNSLAKSAVCAIENLNKDVLHVSKHYSSCDSWQIKVKQSSVPCFKEEDKIFLGCQELWDISCMSKNVKKRGYKALDAKMKAHGFDSSTCYIWKSRQREFVQLEAFLCLRNIPRLGIHVKETCQELETIFTDHLAREKTIQPASDTTNQGKCNGILTLHGVDVPFIRSPDMYLACKELFSLSYSGLEKQIKKEGFTYVDSRLKKRGYSSKTAFIFKGRRRTHIKLTAFLALCDSDPPIDNLQKVKSDILLFLEGNAETLSPDTPVKSYDNNVLKKASSVRKKTQHLRSVLTDLCAETFQDKQEFLQAIGSLINPDKNSPDDNTFSGIFSKQDMEIILTSAFIKDKGNLLSNFVKEKAKSVFNVTPEDLINLEENYSGTRLVEALRKKIGPVLPSQREERQRRRDYIQEFQAVLCPRRTSTGWKIDPFRLMEMLEFLFYWMGQERHWRVYGDGREIGGRHSTFLSLSLLNNEATLYGHSYQDSRYIFPLYIFYESDNRDNLEENLQIPSPLNVFISGMESEGSSFYLCGDEMFLEGVLDGNEVLGPLTESGWNIYRREEKGSKGETSDTGFRTKRLVKIDREHPSSLLPAIPTSRVVFCLLHGETRVVEKLVSLVVEDILSDANKATQRGEDGVFYRESRMGNLEENINRRGVQQGNFHFYFDKSGKPEPVSLNKDAALVILSPPPEGRESSFPHVLNSVLSLRRVQTNIPDTVKTTLQLEEEYTELDLVTSIWHHFYRMVSILRKDPHPKLQEDKPQRSLHPDDYIWGYSEEDRLNYVHHAECFFQLFTSRYTATSLTPYMIKFIDIAPILMNTLPFPVSRFQSEGGEHANYDHNRFYFQHTTRHGGKFRNDPILALFGSIFKRICYSVMEYEDSSEHQAQETSKAFKLFCTKHKAAAILQRNIKGFLVRRKLERLGWCRRPRTMKEQEVNRNIKDRKPFAPVANLDTTNQSAMFRNRVFVLSGCIPKINGKKFNQATLSSLLRENGARIRSKMPGKTKGRSTKKYILLSNQSVLDSKKVPIAVHAAIQNGHFVLGYSFISDCLASGQLQDTKMHQLDFTKFRCKITRRVNLQARHFSKQNNMISLIKERRKKFIRKNMKLPVVGRNPAQFYVFTKRSELCQNTAVSFVQARALLCRLFKDWRLLPETEKAVWKIQWSDAKEKQTKESRAKLQENLDLTNYNKINCPAYLNHS